MRYLKWRLPLMHGSPSSGCVRFSWGRGCTEYTAFREKIPPFWYEIMLIYGYFKRARKVQFRRISWGITKHYYFPFPPFNLCCGHAIADPPSSRIQTLEELVQTLFSFGSQQNINTPSDLESAAKNTVTSLQIITMRLISLLSRLFQPILCSIRWTVQWTVSMVRVSWIN